MSPGWRAPLFGSRLSPDESLLAATLVDPKTSVPDVWITDLIRGGTTRFTFGPLLNANPVWSPGGDRVAFRSSVGGLAEIFEKSTSGGKEHTLLPEDVSRKNGYGASNLMATDWSRDGAFLAVSSGQPYDIWLVPVADNTKGVRIVDSVGDQMHANLSPDGQFVAYTSTESGRRFDVYVETLAAPERKWLLSTDGGSEPRWRADGRDLLPGQRWHADGGSGDERRDAVRRAERALSNPRT
jgi:Tol biopolymer transport system component